MCARLDDFPICHHNNFIRQPRKANAVADQNCGTSAQFVPDIHELFHLGDRVQCRSWLVKYQHIFVAHMTS